MTPQRIQRTYLVLILLQTLAGSFIWGINTLFLLDADLSITDPGAFASLVKVAEQARDSAGDSPAA